MIAPTRRLFALLAVYAILMSLSVRRAKRVAIQEEA